MANEISSLLDDAIYELEQIETYGEHSHVNKALKKLYQIKELNASINILRDWGYNLLD